MSRFSIDFFLSHSAEKFCRGTLLCCVSENIREPRSLRIKGEGVSRFSVEKFLSHSAEKFRRGAFLCCVSENIREPRSLWIRGEGVSRFSVKQLSSHSAEKFCRGTLQCVTILAYRKKFCFRRLCHDFLSIFFVSQCRKIS